MNSFDNLERDLEIRDALMESIYERLGEGSEMDFDLTKKEDVKALAGFTDAYKSIAELDHAIIEALLDDQSQAKLDADLLNRVEYWKAESKKWLEAFTSFRYQNRV